MSRKRKALIAAVHHWHSPIKVGTHYVAEFLLSLGFEVAYISAPITPLHRLLPPSKDLDERRRIHATGGEYVNGSRLWHYVPYSLVAPDNRPALSSYAVFRYWHLSAIPALKSIVSDKGFGKVDLIFLDSIYQSFWLKILPHRASAYRIADNTAGFKGYSYAAKEVEKHIIQSVDQVFVASQSLLDYASNNGAQSAIVAPNGVDLSRFEQGIQDSTADPMFKGPVAIYVGAISYWFNHKLILDLALSYPDLTIILVGPFTDSSAIYTDIANVHLLGEIAPSEVPRYLRAATVGLIPFDVVKYPQLIGHVNPLKLYEYMASGLPVVANHWNELEQLNSPAYIAKTPTEFIAYVGNVIANFQDGQNERAFAEQFDWSTTLLPLKSWVTSTEIINANFSTLS